MQCGIQCQLNRYSLSIAYYACPDLVEAHPLPAAGCPLIGLIEETSAVPAGDAMHGQFLGEQHGDWAAPQHQAYGHGALMQSEADARASKLACTAQTWPAGRQCGMDGALAAVQCCWGPCWPGIAQTPLGFPDASATP